MAEEGEDDGHTGLSSSLPASATSPAEENKPALMDANEINLAIHRPFQSHFNDLF